MTDTTTEEEEGGPVRFMSQVVSLDYDQVATPVMRKFTAGLQDKRITGHKCRQCGKVYVPPRGYCPLCVVETTDDDVVEVADRGTVTTFTVLTPIQYYGQQEREEYVLASILLDGASGTVGQQRIGEIPIDQIRSGMRVEGVWAPPEERKPEDRAALGGSFKYFTPTGEPDVPHKDFEEHVL